MSRDVIKGTDNRRRNNSIVLEFDYRNQDQVMVYYVRQEEGDVETSRREESFFGPRVVGDRKKNE